ncbi:MAG TPA: POTRA domain-containing protein, partial [Myxococcota bacterium]|nr:POTRA domain-containing protein [Myxococcota bacterium]
MALLSVPAAASEYEMCGLGPVRSVSLSGCDVTQCSEAGFVSQVLGVGDFRVGGYLVPEMVPVGLERIRKLGFFTMADVECVYDGDGVDVTVEVRPAIRIASIKFKGNKHFWRSDLSEKLSLRVGDAFDLDDKFNVEQLNSAKNSIEKE